MIGCVALLLSAPQGLAIEPTLTDDVSINIMEHFSLGVRARGKPNGASPMLPLKGEVQRVCLQFDLAPVLPPKYGGQQFKANLRLFVNRVDHPGKVRVFLLPAGEAWNEDSAPARFASFPIPHPLQQGSYTVPQTISAKPATRAKSFLDIDVTPLLQRVAPDTLQITLMLVGEGETALTFDSKENMATSHPASLQINLAPYVPPQQVGEASPNPDPW